MGNIVNILEQKFNFLVRQVGSPDFIRLVLEFEAFICSAPELSDILQKMIIEHKLSKQYAQDLFDGYFLYQLLFHAGEDKVDFKKFKTPLFYTQEIKKMYNLEELFLKTAEEDVSKMKKGNPKDFKEPFLDKRKEIYHIEKMYLDIVQGLYERERVGIVDRSSESISFDLDKSILWLSGKEIKIRKFSEQYHTLEIIFSHQDRLNEEWFFSEIGEKLDREVGYADKDFHNYFSAIKRRVAAETGIKDLFLTTNHSVKINPDYLGKS